MPRRRRLTPEDRRRQLVDHAARAFAAHPYDAVFMDDVAAHAGVSRALLYTHFPTKAALFAAVYQAAADRLVDASPLDPGLPLLDQVRAALDAHLDYFEGNRLTVLTANRTLAGDPVVQAVISDELRILRERLLDARGLTGDDREVVATVLVAWLTFVRVLCVDWLADRRLTRTDVLEVCVGSLLGALQPVLALDPRSPSSDE